MLFYYYEVYNNENICIDVFGCYDKAIQIADLVGGYVVECCDDLSDYNEL